MIKSDTPGKGRGYLVGNEVWHKTIPELVDFYKNHKLTYPKKSVSVYLTNPIHKRFEFQNQG